MISVIVPVYNNAPQLSRCLHSILCQQYEDLEIIAVNDGSTDGSGEILEQFAREYPNIRLIHQENRGVSAARLAGVAAAGGEYIGFVDADDAIDPDMYRRLLENLQRHNAQISHCGHRMEFPDGRIRYFHNTGALQVQDQTAALRALLSGKTVEPGLCSKLFDRQLFSGWEMDESIRINEDLLMNFYLFSRAQTAVFEDFCPYRYILRQGSASRQRISEHRIYDPIRVRQTILQLSPQPLQQDARRALLSTCLSVYNSLLQADFAEDRQKLRDMIRRQRKAALFLCRRQRLAVGLICAVPGLYGRLYRFYANHIQKNPYV